MVAKRKTAMEDMGEFMSGAVAFQWSMAPWHGREKADEEDGPSKEVAWIGSFLDLPCSCHLCWGGPCFENIGFG